MILTLITKNMPEKIILVDKNDQEIGSGEKMKVHQDGKLHRCFSIFVFNSKNEMLLQKRAKEKYHCGGLWTNTCCSHPRGGESLEEATHRRLREEMGFDCELKEIGDFIYKAKYYYYFLNSPKTFQIFSGNQSF